MEEIGQKLKEAREAKGLSILDIEKKTKIQRRYLNAIEDGEFDKLPGDFYVRAFIKQYASVVGLKGSELLNDFHHEVPKTQPEEYVENSIDNKSQHVRETTENKKGLWKNYIPHVLVVLGIIAVIAIIYLVYANFFAKPNTTEPVKDDVVVTKKVESSSSKKSKSSKKATKQSTTKEDKVKIVENGDYNYQVSGLQNEQAELVITSPEADVWLSAVVDGTTSWQGTVSAGQEHSISLEAGVQTVQLNVGNTTSLALAIAGEKVPLPTNTSNNQPRTITFTFAKSVSEDTEGTEGN